MFFSFCWSYWMDRNGFMPKPVYSQPACPRMTPSARFPHPVTLDSVTGKFPIMTTSPRHSGKKIWLIPSTPHTSPQHKSKRDITTTTPQHNYTQNFWHLLRHTIQGSKPPGTIHIWLIYETNEVKQFWLWQYSLMNKINSLAEEVKDIAFWNDLCVMPTVSILFHFLALV